MDDRLNNAKGKALAVASEPVVVSDGARPPLPPVEPPPQQIESIFDRLIAFLRETSMTATPVPLPPATIPIPSVQPGATSGTQRAAEIAAIFAQLANVLSGQRAVAPTGEQPAVVPTTAPTATTPVATTPAATTPPVLSPIDNILGGQVLAGKKTALAVLAYVIMAILQGGRRGRNRNRTDRNPDRADPHHADRRVRCHGSARQGRSRDQHSWADRAPAQIDQA
jgi:hypothetical protein